MTLNPSEIIWTLLNFILLLFFLNRFLFQPYLDFMERRDAKIEQALEAEREAARRLRENHALLRQEEARAQAGHDDMLTAAKAEAASHTRRELAALGAELDAARQREEDGLRRREKELLAGLEGEVMELSSVLLSGLLGSGGTREWGREKRGGAV